MTNGPKTPGQVTTASRDFRRGGCAHVRCAPPPSGLGSPASDDCTLLRPPSGLSDFVTRRAISAWTGIASTARFGRTSRRSRSVIRAWPSTVLNWMTGPTTIFGATDVDYGTEANARPHYP